MILPSIPPSLSAALSRPTRSAGLGAGICFLLLFLLSSPVFAQHGRVSVPLCKGIELSASYLTETGAGAGPGFQFFLKNDTLKSIHLVEPIPSSSHWYALTKGKWMWRASSGAGGSLLDATKEKGRVLVYPVPTGSISGTPVTVQPHQTRTWVSSERENPVLAYKPGCSKCSYPGESEYRVVFAYAFLPDGSRDEGLLACGIRSEPVPMPPKH